MERSLTISRTSPIRDAARLGLLALACHVTLAGCSSEGGDWLPLIKATRLAIEHRDDATSLEEAAAIPYATLGVRLDGGREQMLILASESQGERLWTSAGHVSLVIRGGRIVRTSGFNVDLTAYYASTTSIEDWTHVHPYDWMGDYAGLGTFAVSVKCQVAPAGRDPINILGSTFNTVRVNETCHSSDLSWNFENTYWVSADSGRVWRSIQHIHPNAAVLEIEYLRPPQGQP